MFRVSIYDIKSALPFFQEMVSAVVLPGKEGQLSVWDFHQSMIACLQKGVVEVDNKWFIPIKDGMAQVASNELVLLVERDGNSRG